jgi:MFS family permease
VDGWPRIGKIGWLRKNRPFHRLWAAQFSASTVLYGLNLAGVVVVEEWTQSSMQMGLVILSSILPAFLGSLVAGAVVDRFGRVRLLRFSHLARAFVALVFWASTNLLAQRPALIAIYIINAAAALLTQFATPAEMALLPDLVGQTGLISANTLFQFSLLISEGVGIVLLAPLMIKLAGAPMMGVVGALLYVLAFVLVAALPKDQASTAQAKRKWAGWAAFGTDLKTGWRTIAQDRVLGLVTAQVTLAAVLLLVLLSLVPGLASRHLSVSVETAPFLMLPGGVGFALGSILLNRWEGRASRPGWIAVGLTGVGLNVGLLAILVGVTGKGSLLLSLVLILGIGLALALVIIPARTVLQERPPAALRGRVIAAQLALGNLASTVPLVMGGALADHFGIRSVMGLLGLVALGAGAAGLRYLRS